MNLGQSLFAIGALFILALTILRMNNSILGTDEVALDSKVGVLATSIGTSIIEEASKYPFDEKTKTNAALSTNDLTSSLGQEIDGLIDDFDDYNGYVQNDTIFSIPFKSVCTVQYFDEATMNTTMSRKWNKRLSVQISSPFSKDTLNLSTIYSYWYFK